MINRSSPRRAVGSAVRAPGRSSYEAYLGAGALALLLSSLQGCSQQAILGISDPAIFTMPHIRAAQKAYRDDRGVDSAAMELSPFGNLQRYFASKTAGWEQNRLRMDEMLDQTQQFESFSHVLVQALDVKASLSEGVALPTTNAAKPTSDPTSLDATDAQALAGVLSASPSDSPFDRLERARSFYTSYVLALLRLYRTDSRVVDVNLLDPIATVDAYPEIKDPEVVRARNEIEAARKRRADIDQAALKDRLKTLQDSLLKAQKVVDEAGPLLSKAFDAAPSTLDELAKARTALTKALDAQRANPGTTDAERKATQDLVDKARGVVSEKQADFDKAMAAVNSAIASRDGAAKQVAAVRDEIAVTTQAIDDADWGPARRQATIAVNADAFRALGDRPRRLILVLLQVHVEPGNAADQVAGLDVEIANGADEDVQVLFAHPGRLYDTSDQRMLNKVQQAISTAVSVAPGNAAAELAADSRSRDEARGRYLSRLNKTASFVTARTTSAPSHFGWYFYPSNVVVEKDWLGNYHATGYLEAGGRDCAVWISLPTKEGVSTVLNFKLTPTHGKIDYGSYVREERLAVTVPVSIPDEIGSVTSDLEGITSEIHKLRVAEAGVYTDLYGPVQKFVTEHPLAQKQLKIEFRVELIEEGFVETLLSHVNQQRVGSFSGVDEGRAQAAKLTAPVNWAEWNAVEEFLRNVVDHLHNDRRSGYGQPVLLKNQISKGGTAAELYAWLYGLAYVKPRYILRSDGKGLEQLSPGERGTLLLVFYLLVDDSDVPLIIDQPEANLDNLTVADKLVACIRDARERRQVVIVTHNPNLAVVCDADQIVHASMDIAGGHRISYTTGALENPEMNELAIKVLEGGRPPFDMRDETYCVCDQ